MNSIFSQLSLSRINSSPFFSFQNRKILIFKTIFVQKSFNSFFFSNYPSNQHLIIDSRFKQFLESTIRINSLEKQQEIFRISGYQTKIEHNLTLYNCLFEACSSISIGGAIQFLPSITLESKIICERCLFDLCSSGLHGGAVYCISSCYRFYKTCFIRCRSKNKQTLCSRGESSSINSVNMSIFVQNGIGHNDMITMSQSSSIIGFFYNNISTNVVYSISSGAYLSSNFMCFFYYNHFENNEGTDCVNIHLRNHQSSIHHCNFVSNTKGKEWKALIFVSSVSKISNSVFILNSAPILFVEDNNGSFIISLCSFDCDNEGLWNGNIIVEECQFKDPIISPIAISSMKSDICINVFITGTHSLSSPVSPWGMIVILVAIVIVFIRMFSAPKYKVSDDERVVLMKNKWRDP